MDPGGAPALSAASAALDAAGLNLRGVVAAGRYDSLVPDAWRCCALLPGARSALLLAAGGRALYRAFQASPEAALPVDPLDAYTRRVAAAAAAGLDGVALCAFEQRGGVYADFVALGREAGLGANSRLGLLLHPEYGPWMSLRAAVLSPHAIPPTGALAGFDPCRGCPAPCAAACRGPALAAPSFDPLECGAVRRRDPACRHRCDARRACVLGLEHHYGESAESHHMAALPGA